MDDGIPNIRFNVTKSYGVLIDVLKRFPGTSTVQSNETEGKELKCSRKA